MPPTLWLQSEIDELMRLWDNYSASQIGAQLGRTRNAVIGKINRLSNAKQYERRNGHKIYLDRQPRMPRPASPPKPEVKIVEQPLPIVVKPTRPPCTIYELTWKRCHWPLWDNDSVYEVATLFCGNMVLDNRPYCRQHCEAAYHGFYCPDQVPTGREA